MIEPIVLRPGDLGRYLLPELIKKRERFRKEWGEAESHAERKGGFKLPKGKIVCNEKRGRLKVRNE